MHNLHKCKQIMWKLVPVIEIEISGVIWQSSHFYSIMLFCAARIRDLLYCCLCFSNVVMRVQKVCVYMCVKEISVIIIRVGWRRA